ncbi:MAG: aminopeptidase P N-terminal domain-containing protein [Armatimonadota bacterium]
MTKSFFSPEEFTSRRTRLYDRIGPEAVALVQGIGPVAGFEMPRQTNDLFYLTGIESPQTYLLIDAQTRTSALYLPQGGSHVAGEGKELGAEDADLIREISGVESVFPIGLLTEHLQEAKIVFTPHKPAEGKFACQDTLRHAHKASASDPWDVAPTREELFITLIRERVSGVTVHDLSPLISTMRLVKSPEEVAVMRRAGAICARAVVEVVRSTRPGVTEYQLWAVADYVYRANGVSYEGYRPIIAGGDNIWLIHYYRIDSVLSDGDLVLFDCAPDVANYTSDIGRMWPVNGKYSPQQRELYGFIVEYHKTLLRFIRPGVTPEQVMAEAADVMRPVVESWPFSREIYREGARRTLTFQGHLSHTVGMAVHDGGAYFGQPMPPGLVFALDPQMWIPEEKLYIRVEDTVVVTETGVERLTGDCPLELDEMEALMTEPGIFPTFPAAV